MRLRIKMARHYSGLLVATLTLVSGMASAAEKAEQLIEHNMLMNHGGGHLMDMEGGMVMGQNKDTLPPGCSRISEDASITVRAGHKYSKDFPGTMFGFDAHEWRVKPCTRLTVTFVNEDHIRHQWMMHGLPKFIYDKGMFHLEMTGPAKITGTLILPAEDKTYLVHCDIAQHMEKGMKGQLIVGKGSTPFPSIPGITDLAIPDDYGPKIPDSIKQVVGPVPGTNSPGGSASSTPTQSPSGSIFLLGILIGIASTPLAIRYYKKRFQGMSGHEVIGHLVNSGKSYLDKLLGLLTTLLGGVSKK